MGTSQYIDLPFRKLFKSDDTASYGIVNVMIDICDPVAYLYNSDNPEMIKNNM